MTKIRLHEVGSYMYIYTKTYTYGTRMYILHVHIDIHRHIQTNIHINTYTHIQKKMILKDLEMST